MGNVYQNILALGLCFALVAGGGIWITYFKQEGEMKRLQKAEQLAKSKQAELDGLMLEVTASKTEVDQVMRRWRSRYKVIPTTLVSEEVIAYLNKKTRVGFNPFDVVFRDMSSEPSFKKYIFEITGRGRFNSLYDLIWSIENERRFYRIRNLELSHFDLITTDPDTNRDKMEVMVSFSFVLEAYYGGAAGLSAQDDLRGTGIGQEGGIPTPLPDLSQLPPGILPTRRTALNPFLPLILDQIPPNTLGLLEIEQANLISIVGDQAVFETKDGFVSLALGDHVYLGQITEIDPRQGRVRARLNKGGIIDEIEIFLDTEEQFRQALGPMKLTPSNPY
ncbi:MAG: hypothetical protein IH853_01890 [Bacteroidetes bacterium]|nr:hypothetical protein [Bacteroidota bacterium]MCH8246563.1 hypothetical protein [Bacteroidota bacterium]